MTAGLWPRLAGAGRPHIARGWRRRFPFRGTGHDAEGLPGADRGIGCTSVGSPRRHAILTVGLNDRLKRAASLETSASRAFCGGVPCSANQVTVTSLVLADHVPLT